jgi:hypothetical protein
VPATLAIDALLHEDEDAVWTIPTLDVYPNGFRVNVALQLNPHANKTSSREFIGGLWA